MLEEMEPEEKFSYLLSTLFDKNIEINRTFKKKNAYITFLRQIAEEIEIPPKYYIIMYAYGRQLEVNDEVTKLCKKWGKFMDEHTSFTTEDLEELENDIKYAIEILEDNKKAIESKEKQLGIVCSRKISAMDLVKLRLFYDKRFSIEELAKRLNMSVNNLRYIIEENYKVPKEIAGTVSEYLNIPAEIVFGQYDEPRSPEPNT